MKRLLLLSFSLSMLLGTTLPAHDIDDDYFAIRKNFEIFGSLYENLVLNYVDDVDAERLMRSGIRAMLDELDPYTVFFDEAANEQMNIAARGKTGSPGLSIGRRDNKIIVASPEAGASAYIQGVRTGDNILSIGGINAGDLSASDAYNLLLGDPGTTVDVTIRRDGIDSPLDFRLTRQEISYRSLSFADNVYVGSSKAIYLKLDRFGRHAAREVKAALDSLATDDQNTAIILDLRDNTGGLLGEAVGITSLFLDPGSPVVTTRSRIDEDAQLLRTDGKPVHPNGPLFVLINELSASASEIVAGALQDHDRAVILGSRSFGKGLVQVVNRLPYNTSLKITTARYYIPSGRSIQRIYSDNPSSTSMSVPDSVRTPFTTKGGRRVYDGAGIDPDLVTISNSNSELLDALSRRSAFFFYANHFAARNPELDASFEIDDETLHDFRSWLLETGFDYDVQSEHIIQDLQASLSEAGYAEAPVEELRNHIADQKILDFDRFADEIHPRLRREILARFMNKDDVTRAMAITDPTVLKAFELMDDTTMYDSILSN